MANNKGTKSTVVENGEAINVLEITWQVTDPSTRWYVTIGETNEPALLGRLVSRKAHPQNSGFKVDSWTYEVISPSTLRMMQNGKTPIRSASKPKKLPVPYYPGKAKISVLLVGGPRDGEKMFVAKRTKVVTLNVRTGIPFDNKELPWYVQVDYEKRDDGNFHFID
jgi:hypothetical protein